MGLHAQSSVKQEIELLLDQTHEETQQAYLIKNYYPELDRQKDKKKGLEVPKYDKSLGEVREFDNADLEAVGIIEQFDVYDYLHSN